MVAPVVVAAAFAVPLSADAATATPTPQKVVELIAHSDVTQFSGRVSQTSDLGLPQLPSTSPGSGESGGSGSSGAAGDLSSIVSGIASNHTLRIYVDGTTKQRVQVLDQLAETDVIRNGNSVWVWDSKKQSATHYVFTASAHAGRWHPQLHSTPPAASSSGAPGTGSTPSPAKHTDHVVPGQVIGTATANPSAGAAAGAGAAAMNPATVAKRILAAVQTSSTVTVSGDVSVAGRDAYNLVLTPKAKGSLVSAVAIAVDAKTGLPLRVQVQARGQKDPAISVGFTSIDYSAPSASLFDFSVPTGAHVTTHNVALPARHAHPTAPGTGSAPGAGSASNSSHKLHVGPRVIGTGWTSVVEFPAGTVSARALSNPAISQLTTTTSAGRVFQTSLFTVLITTDGRVFAGAVPASTLTTDAAAAATAG